MRSSRWHQFPTIVTLAACTALLLAAQAESATHLTPVVRSVSFQTDVSKQQRTQLKAAARQVGELRRIAWSCQDTLIADGILEKRTKASHSVWSLPRSVGYRAWVAKKWAAVAKGCQQTRKTHEEREAARTAMPYIDSCLRAIINRENKAMDPTLYNYAGSGAYGIPQALPGHKMASAGADWRTNPATQIRWMIGYVNARYGGSCAAWAFHQRNGYY